MGDKGPRPCVQGGWGGRGWIGVDGGQNGSMWVHRKSTSRLQLRNLKRVGKGEGTFDIYERVVGGL